ncbi:MAG: histidine phosphatase family protein [Bacillus sp. (in: firmicutes)]
MEISLIRHGKSELVNNERITCSDFKKWVEQYDYHGVFEERGYPLETTETVVRAKLIITSDLERSIQSATLLNPRVISISDALFRETGLPTPSRCLWGIKLRPGIWAVLFRLLWFCGYSKGCESLGHAKLRAKQATHQLIDYANKYQSVVLVGHGFFNRLIAKELQKQGWKGNRKTGSEHWTCTTYADSEAVF